MNLPSMSYRNALNPSLNGSIHCAIPKSAFRKICSFLRYFLIYTSTGTLFSSFSLIGLRGRNLSLGVL